MADPKAFSVEISRGAERDVEGFSPDVQRTVVLEIHKWLTKDPFREVKTRIKRLSGFVPPVYRLRIGDYRAYYRIVTDRVVVLAVLHKKDSQRWLRRS